MEPEPGPGKRLHPFCPSQGPAALVCRGPRGLLRTSPAGGGWGGSARRGTSLLAPGLCITRVPQCGDWGCSAGCWEASLTPPFPGPGPQERASGFVNTLGAFCNSWTPCDFLKLARNSQERGRGWAWAQGVARDGPLCAWMDRGCKRGDKGGSLLCPPSWASDRRDFFSRRPLDSAIMPEPGSVCGASVCVCGVRAGPRETTAPGILSPPSTATPDPHLENLPVPKPSPLFLGSPRGAPTPPMTHWLHAGPGPTAALGGWAGAAGCTEGAPCLDRAAEWGGDRVQHRNAPGGPESPRPQ